jgi:ABC-type branched-subunit amino acid transport system ATPase component
MSDLVDNILVARGVTVAFGGVTALNAVDLDVPVGQAFVLCGPNGSGKTTLLNALSGFVHVTGGDVQFRDRGLLKLAPHQRARLGLGRTFQNPHVLPHARVSDMLSFGLHLHDIRSWTKGVFRPLRTGTENKATRDRFRQALVDVGLSEDVLDLDLLSLSLGQLKMVDIARALLAEPQVLLMDEPSSGLNGAEIDRLRDVVHRMRSEGRTAVLVEHNVHFVLDLADRVAVLNRGELLAEGPPRETLQLPSVVEAYLGPRGRPVDRTNQTQPADR